MTIESTRTKTLEEVTWTSRLFEHSDSEPMEEAARLRHAYFVRQKQWVPDVPGKRGMETDSYDAHALHLGVWDEVGLAAYLRVIPSSATCGFMLDHEFACLVPPEEKKSLGMTGTDTGTVELSRLVCRPNICRPSTSGSSSYQAVEALLRTLYHLSRCEGFWRYVIVVEEAWPALLRRRFGLPFEVLGEPHLFPDGTRTVAATATLTTLEGGMQRHSPAKYQWYQQSTGGILRENFLNQHNCATQE